jgi:hypothetical protein
MYVGEDQIFASDAAFNRYHGLVGESPEEIERTRERLADREIEKAIERNGSVGGHSLWNR